MTSIVELSATELRARLRRRELSAQEVVGAHLDRIDEINDDVNALVAMRDREEVLGEADRLDASEPAGALHGLPIAVKDLQDVAGLPTRAGSSVTPDTPATRDGLIAARLRAAGAVIVGKTNTPEFGTGSHTFNDVYGMTRNPWDLSRSAGGSSGGAAAALAGRMLPIADGSDLGGSLRNPAAFNNVVGLRPTIGRVPSECERSTHLLRLSVQGPMGRTVADTALLLGVLAGPHGGDPLSLPSLGEWRPDPDGAAGARVAWAGDMSLFRCEPDVLEICRSAAGRIAALGGRVDVARPDLRDAMRVFRVLRGIGYRDLGAQIPRDRWSELKATVRENIEFGASLSVDDVLEAERLRARIHAEMQRFFEGYDVLALPSAQVAPFPAEIEYPTEIDGHPMVDYLDWMTACCVITPTGCPAISIPAGFTAAGLPVGLQLVAPVGAEERLLDIAAAIESVEPLHLRRPAI